MRGQAARLEKETHYEFQDVFDRRRRVGGYVYGFRGANHKAAGRGSEPSCNPRRSRTEHRRNPNPRSTPATRIYRSDQYWVWRCTCIKSAGRYTSGNAGYASRITRASGARRSEQSPSFDSARSVKGPAGQSQPLNKPVQIEGSQGTLSLRGVLSRYFQYRHRARTHLSLDKDCPQPRRIQLPSPGEILAFPEVGGLHHCYERRAA
jgi:hypothetical protein